MKKNNCPLEVAKAFRVDKHSEIYEIISEGEFAGVKLSLGGINQLDNAACAICAARLLGLNSDSIRYGLTHAKHVGRFEELSEYTYFDGAHNPDGIYALKKNLDRYFNGIDKVYIMAAMADKEVDDSLRILNDDGAEFKMVAVEDNERTMTGAELAKKACNLGLNAQSYGSIKEAYDDAKKTGKMIVICGSLYLYKDFISAQCI